VIFRSRLRRVSDVGGTPIPEPPQCRLHHLAADGHVSLHACADRRRFPTRNEPRACRALCVHWRCTVSRCGRCYLDRLRSLGRRRFCT